MNLNTTIRNIAFEVDEVLQHGTADEAMHIMGVLRQQATRIDRRLANPNNVWNRVQS